MNTTKNPTPTATYVLSTDLKVGMVTTLGPIVNRCAVLTWP